MSSVSCPTSPVYKTSVEQKKHSLQTAKKHQFGSPQLKELLREKCRSRVREARQTKFDGIRGVGKSVGNTLVEKILREELADLEADINLQEIIFQELIDEVDEWFVQQMEAEQEYLINVGEAEDTIVFCPFCEKSELKVAGDHTLVVCECGVSFNFQTSVGDLDESLKKTFAQHESNCNQMLNFFVEECGSERILNAMCEYCDYFKSIL